ncbi:MAG: GTP-binding protein [Euryarchaeota archaeon]|nr:GTP-binding protein [Euryarchaeota archaeon]
MEMIIVAGFLGSGKTTMVLSAIGRIIEKTGKKIVIIVNDFGTVGIDGRVMQKYGLDVMEMASGCICCTLGADLLATIMKLESEVAPDIVIIEPTGVADPSAIVDAMEKYPGEPMERILSTVIVDAVRFPVIYKALNRPLTSQIKGADLVLINKIDAVTPEALKEVEITLRAINPDCPIIATSALHGTDMDEVVAEMVGA